MAPTGSSGGPQRYGEPRRSAMTADYYSLLSKAIASLDRPDAEARRALYDRARRAVIQQLREIADEAELERQLGKLEAGVAQIEDEFARAAAPPPPQPAARVDIENRRPEPEAVARPSRGRHGIIVAGVAAALLLAIGIGALFISQRASKQALPIRHDQAASTPAAARPKAEVVADNEKASYVLRKQMVFYRTTHPAGTLVVSRSQRFLYLVRPSQVAIRYAIGVGPDCAGLSGLFHIEEKLDRAVVASGGPAMPNLFGSHALMFGERRAVHETTQPQNIGQSATAGCFHSWNPDILDLYERVPVNERLVVMD